MSLKKYRAAFPTAAAFIVICLCFTRPVEATGLKSYEVADGVTYTEESSVHTLSFHPKDGYIAMPFAGYAGTSGSLETHYKCAIGGRFGYEVAGVINGGFFGMSDPYGILAGINAYSGRLGSAHLPYSGDDIAFFSDGSIKPVSYTLHSEINIGGNTYRDLVGCFNERRSTVNASAWSTVDQLYYYDSLCGTKCDTYFSGTEILCNKTDNTELSIGYSLIGEVVSVTTGTFGGTVGNNQFILYYPDTSGGYTSLVRSVQPGEKIRISIECSDASANELLSEAIGIIPNIGWLVKDGVNRTETESVIGTHSVSLATGWTAFGWKEDGTVVFMVSETQKFLTMRDIARKLLDTGCTNVVRLDGGGSSAMYLADAGQGQPGYAYNQGRAVADCMLVLKRTSAVTPALKNALRTKIAEYEDAPAYLASEFDHAKKVYASQTSTDADYRHALMGLNGNRSFESVRWEKQPTDGREFELEYTFPNCLFVDTRITSLKTGRVIREERKACSGSLYFENSEPIQWGKRFRVELIPGGDESRTHFVLYGEERNVVTFPSAASVRGDFNEDGKVTSDDAIHLLYHTLLPEKFPVSQDADVDGNGKVTSDDAIYLLYYTLLPEQFPMK